MLWIHNLYPLLVTTKFDTDGRDETNIVLRQGGQINPKRELGLATMNEFDVNRLSPEARIRPSSATHNPYSNWRNNHSSCEITPDMLAAEEGSSNRNTGEPHTLSMCIFSSFHCQLKYVKSNRMNYLLEDIVPLIRLVDFSTLD